jgi:hypothetical protein
VGWRTELAQHPSERLICAPVLETPDITKAQKLAISGWIAAQLVSFGLMSSTNSQIAVSIGATVLAAALHFADAHIRHGRALGDTFKGATVQTIERGTDGEKISISPAAADAK